MKKCTFIVVAITLVLSGCASPRFGTEGYNPALVRKPDPFRPNVFIAEERYISVDQEPIVVPAVEGRVTISWALPFASDYSFPDNRAITLYGSEGNALPKDLLCEIVGRSAKTFACSYTRTGKARWKYSVRVNKGTGELERLDPFVWQN